MASSISSFSTIPSGADEAGGTSFKIGGLSRFLIGASLLALPLIGGCGTAAAPAKDRKVEVVVTTPVADEVMDYQDFTGRMDAFRTIDIRARVTGYVDSAPFKEGDRVHKGDVLYEIDPRTYKAQVDQAEADLATRKAQTVRAEALYRRSLDLFRTRGATQEDIDNQKGDWEVARASILLSEAKLRDAKLNLDFCHVISPFDGRVSRRNVDPGNLVRADDTLLTTIVADDQVYAYFDVDERTYLDLVGETTLTSPDAKPSNLKLPVLMRLANSEDFTYPGSVDFLDNRLNGNTGTIRMRAIFPNPRDTLKSGLFVRIRLPVGKPYRALLIPDEAIQSDQGKKYVFVVKPPPEGSQEGGVVEYRAVVPGQSAQALRVLGPVKKDPSGKSSRDWPRANR